MNDSVCKPDDSADYEDQEHRGDAQIIVVHPIEHGHRQDHSGKREHTLDGEIYRSHKYDEGLAEAEDEGYRRVLAHPHEISKAEEFMIDSGDDRTQENENHRRRPGRRPPAPLCPGRRACRWRKIKRCAQGA